MSTASKPLSSSQRETWQGGLNKHGTELWNGCINARRSKDGDVPQKRKTLMLQATTLAFFMLAMPYKTQKIGAEDGIRLLEVAVNAGRHCLGKHPIGPETIR